MEQILTQISENTYLARTFSAQLLLVLSPRSFMQEYKFFDGLVLSEKGSKKVWNNIIPDTFLSVLPLEKSYGKQKESQKSGIFV